MYVYEYMYCFCFFGTQEAIEGVTGLLGSSLKPKNLSSVEDLGPGVVYTLTKTTMFAGSL